MMFSQRSNLFNVTLNNEPILEIAPSHTISLGIGYQVLIPGIVPLFEEHDTRSQAGYTLHEWEDLDPLERAFEVAYRRLKSQIDLHRDAAVANASRPKGK